MPTITPCLWFQGLRRRDQTSGRGRRDCEDAAGGHVLGDRYGVITDPFGHQWSLATHQKDLTPEEMAAGMQEAFSQG